MNISKSLKTGALAIVLVVATASASFAATGWMEKNTNVKKNHNGGAPVVNFVSEGQEVNIVSSWKNWYKIKIPGKDGWVKKNRVSFDDPSGPWGPGWGNDWDNAGASFCINGDKAQFCIGAGN